MSGLSEREMEVIRRALVIAIEEYTKHRNVCESVPRLAEQFGRQRTAAQQLLSKLQGDPVATPGRFAITEVENADGEVIEWIVTDAIGEYDGSSFDSEEMAREEVEILEREVARCAGKW